MKIKTKEMSYKDVLSLPRKQHKLPSKPNRFLASIIRLASASDLKDVNFSWDEIDMIGLEDVPCLILMNHSSFVDLEITAKIFKNRPYNIICTSDGFIGKEWLMRQIGCIPTQKFVRDVSLISDMEYALHTLKTSVLMYPEASYSFDGCPTPLPRKLGVLIKKLNVPLIGVKTFGAFARDPLYNCLQKRKVNVSAEVRCLGRPDDFKSMSVKEIDELLDSFFTFDNFKWQQDNNVIIDEPFRADGLNRMLYKCPNCLNEGTMLGQGTKLICQKCNAEYELDKYGNLVFHNDIKGYNHIPDWYNWERQEVKKEIINGTYRLNIPVNIGVMIDYNSIYMVGQGRLEHNINGFHLTSTDGEIDYTQSPLSCYSLYSDFFWYEIGDMICIGNNDILYYCFPIQSGDIVAKTRMAAEEIYKISSENKKSKLKSNND